MKISATALLTFALLLSGCSNEPIEVTITCDGTSNHTIRISVEKGEDIVIDDPYEEEIRSLKQAFATERENFIKNRDAMTSEQRKAYGERRDETGEKVRELEKLRRAYIAAEMQKHDSVSFKLETRNPNSETQVATDYLESLENH